MGEKDRQFRKGEIKHRTAAQKEKDRLDRKSRERIAQIQGKTQLGVAGIGKGAKIDTGKLYGAGAAPSPTAGKAAKIRQETDVARAKRAKLADVAQSTRLMHKKQELGRKQYQISQKVHGPGKIGGHVIGSPGYQKHVQKIAGSFDASKSTYEPPTQYRPEMPTLGAYGAPGRTQPGSGLHAPMQRELEQQHTDRLWRQQGVESQSDIDADIQRQIDEVKRNAATEASQSEQMMQQAAQRGQERALMEGGPTTFERGQLDRDAAIRQIRREGKIAMPPAPFVAPTAGTYKTPEFERAENRMRELERGTIAPPSTPAPTAAAPTPTPPASTSDQIANLVLNKLNRREQTPMGVGGGMPVSPPPTMPPTAPPPTQATYPSVSPEVGTFADSMMREGYDPEMITARIQEQFGGEIAGLWSSAHARLQGVDQKLETLRNAGAGVPTASAGGYMIGGGGITKQQEILIASEQQAAAAADLAKDYPRAAQHRANIAAIMRGHPVAGQAMPGTAQAPTHRPVLETDVESAKKRLDKITIRSYLNTGEGFFGSVVTSSDLKEAKTAVQALTDRLKRDSDPRSLATTAMSSEWWSDLNKSIALAEQRLQKAEKERAMGRKPVALVGEIDEQGMKKYLASLNSIKAVIEQTAGQG